MQMRSDRGPLLPAKLSFRGRKAKPFYIYAAKATILYEIRATKDDPYPFSPVDRNQNLIRYVSSLVT